MTHPGPEEWMSYVYGELSRPARSVLATHLQSCPECREQVSQWQATQKRLAHWKVDADSPEPASTWVQPALKWAAAAVVVLGLGFGFGRLSAPPADPGAIQVAVEQSLRSSLAADLKRQIQDELQADLQAAFQGAAETLNTDFRRDLRTGLDEWRGLTLASAATETRRLMLDLSDSLHATRQQDQKTILTLFDRADQQRRADYLRLRRAVETVAVVADNKFQRTETELGNLASYAQTKFTQDPLEDSTNN